MSDYAGTTVLVTGAAGFVGSNLVRALLGAGSNVVGADDCSSGSIANLSSFSTDPHFRFAKWDVREGTITGTKFDYVFHLACSADTIAYQRDPVKTLETCSQGTRNVLEVVHRDAAKLIFTSTSEIYGNPSVHPQREDYFGNVNPTGPRSMYDEGKRFAEALITAHGINASIVRLFNTYGPGMGVADHRLIPTFVRQALAGESLTVHGDGTQSRSFCYVDDTVDALLRAGQHLLRGPVNIGNPEEISVMEAALLVLRVTTSSSRLVFVERPAEDPDRRRPDITLAETNLGWRPQIGLREGLKRYVDVVLRERRASESDRSSASSPPLIDGPPARGLVSAEVVLRPTSQKTGSAGTY